MSTLSLLFALLLLSAVAVAVVVRRFAVAWARRNGAYSLSSPILVAAALRPFYAVGFYLWRTLSRFAVAVVVRSRRWHRFNRYATQVAMFAVGCHIDYLHRFFYPVSHVVRVRNNRLRRKGYVV